MEILETVGDTDLVKWETNCVFKGSRKWGLVISFFVSKISWQPSIPETQRPSIGIKYRNKILGTNNRLIFDLETSHYTSNWVLPEKTEPFEMSCEQDG